MWNKLKSKTWMEVVFLSRFAKSFARKRFLDRKKAPPAYKRTKSGRVTGCAGLKATGAYTPSFCTAVMEAWEDTVRGGGRPKPLKFKTLPEILAAVGFIPCATSAQPAFRRMTQPGPTQCSVLLFPWLSVFPSN